MSFIDIILPNINASTAYAFVLMIIGGLLLALSYALPPSINYKVARIGWIGLFGGLVLVYLISFFQDFFSNIKLVAVTGSIILVALIAFFLFNKK